MTVHDALDRATRHIARRDAETLLLHLLQRDRAWLLAHGTDALTPATSQTFLDHTRRRAAHEPLQYITGTQEFFGLPLRVTPDTLIPRPETEHLVEAVLTWASTHPATRVLDIGTGTGAIALALAQHLPGAKLFACDLSAAALTVAHHNATSLGLLDRIAFKQSDLLSAYATPPESFDIIVSNPPYIPLSDAAEMQPEVRDHEPHSALFAGVDGDDGDDGLEVYRRLIPQAHAALAPNGLLALEFGFGQRDALAALLPSPSWQNIRFLDDYAGIPRVALAEKSPA